MFGQIFLIEMPSFRFTFSYKVFFFCTSLEQEFSFGVLRSPIKHRQGFPALLVVRVVEVEEVVVEVVVVEEEVEWRWWGVFTFWFF